MAFTGLMKSIKVLNYLLSKLVIKEKATFDVEFYPNEFTINSVLLDGLIGVVNEVYNRSS